MDYGEKTKKQLMETLDRRDISYKKKDVKETLVALLEESDKDGEAIKDRLEKTKDLLRGMASKIRETAKTDESSHKEPSSRISVGEITKYWDESIKDPAKARERAIKLAKRSKAKKQAKKSRRANR